MNVKDFLVDKGLIPPLDPCPYILHCETCGQRRDEVPDLKGCPGHWRVPK